MKHKQEISVNIVLISFLFFPISLKSVGTLKQNNINLKLTQFETSLWIMSMYGPCPVFVEQ